MNLIYVSSIGLMRKQEKSEVKLITNRSIKLLEIPTRIMSECLRGIFVTSPVFNQVAFVLY